jgi:hypothetical protein
MRDLKRTHSTFFWPFRPTSTFYNTRFPLSYEPDVERLSCYDGHTFRLITLKEAMSGYPIRAYVRTKIAGRSIHLRSKKKKGK